MPLSVTLTGTSRTINGTSSSDFFLLMPLDDGFGGAVGSGFSPEIMYLPFGSVAVAGTISSEHRGVLGSCDPLGMILG